ncbi:MAG: hypothetical protein IKB76_01175, partial [Kiritimatiellae bacterium]|nr:hypothetical protein [Kiritimatiellia bacterium]
LVCSSDLAAVAAAVRRPALEQRMVVAELLVRVMLEVREITVIPQAAAAARVLVALALQRPNRQHTARAVTVF